MSEFMEPGSHFSRRTLRRVEAVHAVVGALNHEFRAEIPFAMHHPTLLQVEALATVSLPTLVELPHFVTA